MHGWRLTPRGSIARSLARAGGRAGGRADGRVGEDRTAAGSSIGGCELLVCLRRLGKHRKLPESAPGRLLVAAVEGWWRCPPDCDARNPGLDEENGNFSVSLPVDAIEKTGV